MFSEVVKIPPSNFVCKNASPGIGCGFPEMLFLGILYLLSALFCLIRFILYLRKYISLKKAMNIDPTLEEQLTRTSSTHITSNISNMDLAINNTEISNHNNPNDDSNTAVHNSNNTFSKMIPIFFSIFWFSMFFWLAYDAIVTIVPFNYSFFTYRFIYLDLDKILSLIPLSFFVLLVLEICFAWKSRCKNYNVF